MLQRKPEQLGFFVGRHVVAAAATAMLDRLIILPITPPAELAEAIRTGLKPSF